MESKNNANDVLKVVEGQEITAKNIGFYWENIGQITDQIRSECLEIEEAWKHDDKEHLQEEVGDLLQASVSLAVYCGMDPSETLRKSSFKFQKRFDLVVQFAKQDGYEDLHQLSMKVLLGYWDRAKDCPCNG